MLDIGPTPSRANPDSRRQRDGTTGMPRARTRQLRPRRLRFGPASDRRPEPDAILSPTPPWVGQATGSVPYTDGPAADAFRRPPRHLPLERPRCPWPSSWPAPVDLGQVRPPAPPRLGPPDNFLVI